MHDIFSDFIGTFFAIKDAARLDITGVNCGGGTEYFHGRARFKRIRDGAVAPQLLVEIGIGIRIKKRSLRQGQDGAGLGLHYNCHSRPGGIFLDGFLQCAFRDVL